MRFAYGVETMYCSKTKWIYGNSNSCVSNGADEAYDNVDAIVDPGTVRNDFVDADVCSLYQSLMRDCGKVHSHKCWINRAGVDRVLICERTMLSDIAKFM